MANVSTQDSASGQISPSVVVLGGATVKYNFGPVAGVNQAYTLTISLTASQYAYKQAFTFAPGDSPAAVQEVIYQSLNTAGFVVINSATGNAVIISGYKATNAIVPLDKQTLDTGKLPDKNKPVVTGSLTTPPPGGQTQSPDTGSNFSTPWELSFDATSETSIEEQDSIIQVFLNGQEIDTDALLGMTSSQVDALVAANLSSAGVDATVSGGYINFTNLNGKAVNQVVVSYASAPTGDTYVPTLATTFVFPT